MNTHIASKQDGFRINRLDTSGISLPLPSVFNLKTGNIKGIPSIEEGVDLKVKYVIRFLVLVLVGSKGRSIKLGLVCQADDYSLA